MPCRTAARGVVSLPAHMSTPRQGDRGTLGGRGVHPASWVLVAIAVVFAVVFWAQWEGRRRGFHWAVFRDTLAALDWRWLLLATVLALSTYAGRALRWAVLLKPLRARPNLWKLFSATVIGFTAVTLFGRPGEFVRPYLIAAREQVAFSSQAAAWALERMYDLLMALAIFGFGLSQVRGSGVEVGPALSWVLQVGGAIVGVAGGGCLLLLAMIRLYAEPVRRRLLRALGFLSEHHFARAERMLQAFVQGVESIRSYRAVLMLSMYTVVEWILIMGCYLCVTRAFHVRFGVVDILIFMGFVTFGSMVQVPGIGGGVQVVSVLVLTEVFGLKLEIATSMALVIWLITFVVIAPFGVALAFHEGLNWRKLKQLEREAAA